MTDSSLGMEGGMPNSVIQRSLIAGTPAQTGPWESKCTAQTGEQAAQLSQWPHPPRSYRKQRRGWCVLIETNWEGTRRSKSSRDVSHPSQVKRQVCSVYIQAADDLLLSVKTELAVHIPRNQQSKNIRALRCCRHSRWACRYRLCDVRFSQ